MNLFREVEREKDLLEKILAVADRAKSLGFADLFRGGDDLGRYIQRIKLNQEDPGVKFTTSTRIVVMELHSGELRYYAGGWPSSQSRINEEQSRILAEGCELGNFRTVEDGLRFAEKYLVAQEAIQDIKVLRSVLSRRETAKQNV